SLYFVRFCESALTIGKTCLFTNTNARTAATTSRPCRKSVIRRSRNARIAAQGRRVVRDRFQGRQGEPAQSRRSARGGGGQGVADGRCQRHGEGRGRRRRGGQGQRQGGCDARQGGGDQGYARRQTSGEDAGGV